MTAPFRPLGWHWRRDLLFAVLLALVPPAMALAHARTCAWFYVIEDDGISAFQPRVGDSLDQTLSGQLPLWSDATRCGHPLLGFAATGPLFPGYYVARGMCRVLGLEHQEVACAYLLHMALGTFFAFLYLRLADVRRTGASLGALAFGLAGPWFGMCHNWPSYGMVIAHAPLAFIVVERLIAPDRSWFWVCLGGLTGSMVLLIGDLPASMTFCIFVAAYFLVRCPRPGWLTSALSLAAAGLVSMAIASGPLLANFEYIGLTTRVRAEGVDLENAYFTSLPPWFFAGAVFPFAQFDWEWGWLTTFVGGGLFVGPLAAFALLLALAHWFRPGAHRALLVLLVLFGVLCLGWYFLPNAALQFVPGFKQFRWPIRWTTEFCAIAALLSGVGVELWQRHFAARATQIAFLAFATLVGVVLACSDLVSPPWDESARLMRVVWIVFVAVLGWAVFARRQAAFTAVAFGFTLFALVASIPMAQHSRWAIMSPLLNEPLVLEADPNERVLMLATLADLRKFHGEGNYLQCFPHRFGTRPVLGYAFAMRDQQRWMPGTDMVGLVDDPAKAVHSFLDAPHLLDTLRVSHVVVAKDDQTLVEACRRRPGLLLERERRWTLVFRNAGFRQPAFFVERLIPVGESMRWEDMGWANLSKEAWIDGPSDGPTTFDDPGRVREFHERNGAIRFLTESAQAGFVVVTTTKYPGWHAFVDDAEVPIHQVNGSFMGVNVPPGHHEIRFRFRPGWLIHLLAANVILLAAVYLLCFIGFLRRWRREAEGH